MRNEIERLHWERPPVLAGSTDTAIANAIRIWIDWIKSTDKLCPDPSCGGAESGVTDGILYPF